MEGIYLVMAKGPAVKNALSKCSFESADKEAYASYMQGKILPSPGKVTAFALVDATVLLVPGTIGLQQTIPTQREACSVTSGYNLMQGAKVSLCHVYLCNVICPKGIDMACKPILPGAGREFRTYGVFAQKPRDTNAWKGLLTIPAGSRKAVSLLCRSPFKRDELICLIMASVMRTTESAQKSSLDIRFRTGLLTKSNGWLQGLGGWGRCRLQCYPCTEVKSFLRK